MRKFFVIVATMFLLVGCSSAGADATPENTPELTPQEATPQQVASIIAEYENDWREYEAGNVECRLIWVLDSPSDPIANIEGTSCYLKEQTASITASTALRKLQSLNEPADLEELVTRTKNALSSISSTDVREACGEDSWPADTTECTSALATTSTGYMLLIPILDAWKPYL